MRALIIEDDEVLAMAGERALRQSGMVVEVAHDKAQALDLLLNAPDYDVVVSDIDLSGDGGTSENLSNRDGYYFVQFARDRRAEVPIFFYSSKVQDDQLGDYEDEDRKIYVISKDWMSNKKSSSLVPIIAQKAETYQQLKVQNAQANAQRISEQIEFDSPVKFARSPQAATIRNSGGLITDRGEDLVILDDHRIRDLLSFVSQQHGKEIGECDHISLLQSPIGVWLKFLPNSGGCYVEVHNASTIRSFGNTQEEALSRLAELLYTIKERNAGGISVELTGVDQGDIDFICAYLKD